MRCNRKTEKGEGLIAVNRAKKNFKSLVTAARRREILHLVTAQIAEDEGNETVKELDSTRECTVDLGSENSKMTC